MHNSIYRYSKKISKNVFFFFAINLYTLRKYSIFKSSSIENFETVLFQCILNKLGKFQRKKINLSRDIFF